MMYVSDGIRKFALEKHITRFVLSSLGKQREQGPSLGTSSVRTVSPGSFPCHMHVGIKGDRWTFHILFVTPLSCLVCLKSYLSMKTLWIVYR